MNGLVSRVRLLNGLRTLMYYRRLHENIGKPSIPESATKCHASALGALPVPVDNIGAGASSYEEQNKITDMRRRKTSVIGQPLFHVIARCCYSAIGHEPRDRFLTLFASTETSNSKMSIGKPSVVHAFGISTIPAIDPLMGAQDSSRYICSPEYPIAPSQHVRCHHLEALSPS